MTKNTLGLEEMSSHFTNCLDFYIPYIFFFLWCVHNTPRLFLIYPFFYKPETSVKKERISKMAGLCVFQKQSDSFPNLPKETFTLTTFCFNIYWYFKSGDFYWRLKNSNWVSMTNFIPYYILKISTHSSSTYSGILKSFSGTSTTGGKS